MITLRLVKVYFLGTVIFWSMHELLHFCECCLTINKFFAVKKTTELHSGRSDTQQTLDNTMKKLKPSDLQDLSSGYHTGVVQTCLLKIIFLRN